MAQRIYKIRKALQIPLGIDVVLLLILLLMAFLWKGSTAERIALCVLFFPTLFFFIEILYRKITIDDSGIAIKKFLKLRELSWNDITHVGHLIIRKKVYILFTTVKGYHIISNAYEGFSNIVKDVLDHMAKEKVEDQLALQIEKPTRETSNVAAIWIAAVIMVAIIITKFYPLY